MVVHALGLAVPARRRSGRRPGAARRRAVRPDRLRQLPHSEDGDRRARGLAGAVQPDDSPVHGSAAPRHGRGARRRPARTSRRPAASGGRRRCGASACPASSTAICSSCTTAARATSPRRSCGTAGRPRPRVNPSALWRRATATRWSRSSSPCRRSQTASRTARASVAIREPPRESRARAAPRPIRPTFRRCDDRPGRDRRGARSRRSALRRSERMLEQSQAAAQVGSWEVAYDETSRRCPAALSGRVETYRIFGYRARHPGHPESVPRARAPRRPRRRCGAERRANSCAPKRSRRSTGSCVPTGACGWCAAGSTSSPRPDGKTTRAFGTCQDITERNHAEMEIRRAREQLQLVVDTTPAFIARYDRDGGDLGKQELRRALRQGARGAGG